MEGEFAIMRNVNTFLSRQLVEADTYSQICEVVGVSKVSEQVLSDWSSSRLIVNCFE